MKRISFWFTTAAFSLMVLGLPAIASAQYYPNGGYNDGRNNGGYYGNNGYGVDTRQTVRNLKNSTRNFQRTLDRELDRSRVNGTRREDQLNQMAKDFKRSVDRLNDRFDQRNENNIRHVLNMASDLDRLFGRSRFGYEVTNNWSAVRSNLDNLARAYGIYNRNYRNDRNGGWGNGRDNGNGNGGWGNGRGRGNMPNWWPF